MTILKFMVFFALYFSIFFLLPSALLKGLVKVSRKKKDPSLKAKLYIFIGLSLLYILSFGLMNITISDSIKELSELRQHIFLGKDVLLLGLANISFLIISVIYTVYTYKLNIDLFKIKKNEDSYVIVSIYALFTILAYYFLYTRLQLQNYSFESVHFILNYIYKINYDMITYLYTVLIGVKFALSFIKE